MSKTLIKDMAAGDVGNVEPCAVMFVRERGYYIDPNYPVALNGKSSAGVLLKKEKDGYRVTIPPGFCKKIRIDSCPLDWEKVQVDVRASC